MGRAGDPDLADVARELYGLPPAEFTAHRNARATSVRAADRDRAAAVRALPKPSVAAWVVNTLARRRPDAVVAALGLGARLAAAQEALDGTALRTLAKEQQALLADLRGQAAAEAEAAGVTLSQAVVAQVEGTVRAAMADRAAARALATGLLVRELHSTGLEPVDLAGALAVPDAPPLLGVPERHTHAPSPRPAPTEQPSSTAGSTGGQPAAPDPARPRARSRAIAAERDRRERARRARADAQARLTAAELAVQDADRAVRDAQAAERALAERSASLTEHAEALTAQLDALRAELATVRGDLVTLRTDQHRASAAHQDAVRAARTAARTRSAAAETLAALDET